MFSGVIFSCLTIVGSRSKLKVGPKLDPILGLKFEGDLSAMRCFSGPFFVFFFGILLITQDEILILYCSLQYFFAVSKV